MNDIDSSKLKEKLNSGQASIGSWITMAHPAIPEILSDAGFEWLVVDLEHSVITIREAEELIRVIDLKGLIPLVRLTCNDAGQIKRVMDAGAKGIIVPMVNTREDAETAVIAAKYPPVGNRGVGLARAQGYGATFEAYAETINDESLVIVQVEHIDSVRNLEEILSVAGVDATMVGPYDLSGSMGKPGQFDDENVQAVLKDYVEISKKHGKPLGIHVVQPDGAKLKEKMDEGYSFIAFSTDFLFLRDGCARSMKSLL